MGLNSEQGEETLAKIQAALKAARASRRRQTRNRWFRSQARSLVKKAGALIAAGQIAEAEKAARLAVRALDKAAEKGVLHKNNAARRKSRLMHKLNRAKMVV